MRRKLLHKYSEETLLPTDNTKEESCEDGWSGRIHPDTGDCDGPTCPIYSLLRQLLGSLHVGPGHHLSTLATNTYSPLTSLCSKSSNRWILKIFKLGRLSLWYNWNRWWLSADLHIEPLVHISILYCLCVYLIDIVYLLFHTWEWSEWAVQAVQSEWVVQAVKAVRAVQAEWAVKAEWAVQVVWAVQVLSSTSSIGRMRSTRSTSRIRSTSNMSSIRSTSRISSLNSLYSDLRVDLFLFQIECNKTSVNL